MRTGMPVRHPRQVPGTLLTASFPTGPRNNLRSGSGRPHAAPIRPARRPGPASGPDPISYPIGPSPDYRGSLPLVESLWDVGEHGPADVDDRLRSTVRLALGGVRGVSSARDHPPKQRPPVVETEVVRPGLVTGGNEARPARRPALTERRPAVFMGTIQKECRLVRPTLFPEEVMSMDSPVKPEAGPREDAGTAQKPLLLYEVKDGVAVLTLNHPERRNALSRAMLQELKRSLDRAAADDQVRAVVIRAVGPVFSSGHDLRELVGQPEADVSALFDVCTDVMETVRTLPKPVIAQVHALATAAGCQLVATCDLVVASENATFATPGVKNGLFCTTPGVAVARAVGPRKAMEMLLTGTPISAEQAQRADLVNRIVPAGRLEEETMALARQVIAASAYTLAIGKRGFYQQIAKDRPEAYEVAQKVMVENALAPDAQEGMRAFLEKRPPRWQH